MKFPFIIQSILLAFFTASLQAWFKVSVTVRVTLVGLISGSSLVAYCLAIW